MNGLGDMELPPGWAWSILEEVLAAEPRAITDGPFGSNLKSVHYTDKGARVLRLQNVGDGVFRDERAYISLEHFETLNKHEAEEGDLIIASLGEVLPRAAVVPKLGGPAIVKADVIRARIHKLVSTKWILYALLSPQIRSYTASRIKGVGRPRLGLGEIRGLPIPLPPLNEQLRIVECLEEHLSRVDSAEADLGGSLAHIPRLVDGMRNSATRYVSPTARPHVSWPLGKLSDVLDRIEAGKSFQCEPRPAAEAEWGVIKVSAMTWGEFRAEEQKAVPSSKPVDSRHEIQPGDVLVSRANTAAHVGAPVLVQTCRPRLLLSDKSLRLVPRAGVDKRWLLHVLSSPFVRNQISRKATGTKDSMRNISQRDLLDINIPMPPHETQKRIGDSLDIEVDRIGMLGTQLRLAQSQARRLRLALLGQAISGRLVTHEATDEPASVLLDRIRSERMGQGGTTKRVTRRSRATSTAKDVPPPPTSSIPTPTTAVQQELPL
ncbi:MAG: hypothetical protein HKP61_06740 [Dactylosporangium sp.]|nr:restriction endonuclease subunit S [Dactylosporangium sp.]NNJ60641.1 hypothetical protein [Dactylosporangium sp.]